MGHSNFLCKLTSSQCVVVLAGLSVAVLFIRNSNKTQSQANVLFM